MTKSKSTAATPQAQKTKYLSHEFNPSETNWAALTFPADPYGMSSKLRREFRDMVLRCRGSNEKFQHVLDNLEVLMAWAAARLEADKASNAVAAEAATARAAEEARQEEFRARIQAGTTIKVMATATGFIEQTRNGAVLAVYNTADDARGPVAAMAEMMLNEGRNPNSQVEIHAFGRPGIGSGQTLQQLAAIATGTTAQAPTAPAGLTGIRS
ncbi:hypothetical protein E4L95_05350 [Paracoccus liaowanqingii]|uniref:Uncharacterized protein n=1 Tax=Paracoccus liaowanqingii TaxID=2560053 RepID=A0A4Z1CQW9_9RHOB|nr:hypothetical protein [Paracoccus liaowanqingii]TGN67331.1 hypothetical protein E4L95_05350 [Paracoccus liaowanqingii]